MATAKGLPTVVQRVLEEFCSTSKTGTLQLDIKDGNVIGYRLTEAGRVDRNKP